MYFVANLPAAKLHHLHKTCGPNLANVNFHLTLSCFFFSSPSFLFLFSGFLILDCCCFMFCQLPESQNSIQGGAHTVCRCIQFTTSMVVWGPQASSGPKAIAWFACLVATQLSKNSRATYIVPVGKLPDTMLVIPALHNTVFYVGFLVKHHLN